MVQETLIISNKELNEILKFVQALEDSNIFLRGVSKTIINETKELKEGFLEMLLGTLRASLMGNMLSGKGMLRASYGSSIIPPHLLTNYEMQKYYQNEPRFNGGYTRDNLPKRMKDGAFIKNLEKYTDVGTHWIALYGAKLNYFF